MKSFNLMKWVEDNRNQLKPPVSNKCLFDDGTFIVMMVGGPNERDDFHVNATDEFFYQLEGELNLRIRHAYGNFEDIKIGPGEVFLLKGGIPHSPQRSAGSVGLVVEKSRTEGEVDSLQWFCQSCGELIFEESFHMKDIEAQLQLVFAKYEKEADKVCRSCGFKN